MSSHLPAMLLPPDAAAQHAIRTGATCCTEVEACTPHAYKAEAASWWQTSQGPSLCPYTAQSGPLLDTVATCKAQPELCCLAAPLGLQQLWLSTA